MKAATEAVLVTGGMGAIGSWVTRQLIEQGTKVVVYQRHPDLTFLKDLPEPPGFVSGDVLDLPNLIHTIQAYGVKRVIHLSSLLIPALESNPFMGYRVNVDGSLNVLEAARLTGVKRVVCTSSKSVYQTPQGEYAHPTYRPIDEDYPKEPINVYGATKLFVENMGFSYYRIYGLDFIALRFASIYGPGRQVRHGDVAITSKIIESAMLGKPFKIPQGRDQINDTVYQKDVANGVVLACFAENLEHRVFHFGSGKAESLGDMVAVLEGIYGRLPIEIGPGLGTSSWGNYCVFNIERARRELGYQPQYTLEEGVKDYIATLERLDIAPVVLP